MTDMLRVDLHSHTRASHDSWTPPAVLVERAAQLGIDRIAVTDHGQIDGAFEAHAIDPDRVIVGEEVFCRERVDVIGLFLRERIPNGLPAAEVADRIRDQGGVVYAPHPCAYPLNKAARSRAVLDVADVVEVANSRAFWPSWNRLAVAAAERRGLPAAAGSDGHFPWEIGRCHVEMPSFSDADGFRVAVRDAQVVVRTIATPLMPLASYGVQFAKWPGRWLGRRRPAVRAGPGPARAGG